MGKVLAFVYGVVCYFLAVHTILYAIGFEENLLVPKGIDDGVVGPIGEALLINTLLLALFAVQHTIMARPGFKAWWTKIIPKPIERSTFVLAATLVFALFLWQWRPIAGVVWSVDHDIGAAILIGINFLGWAIFFWSTFLINHFELFGLQQVYNHLRGAQPPARTFKNPSLYKLCRHPMMLGFLIAFWATPHMTVGHLFFSIAVTAYIFMGMWFEERDLVTALGPPYEAYRQEMPMILPFGRRSTEKVGADKGAE